MSGNTNQEESKEISLKEKYKDRHGFVIRCASGRKEDAEKIAEIVHKAGASEKPIEEILRVNDLWIFIFPENSKFESGAFFESVNEMIAAQPLPIQFALKSSISIDMLQSALYGLDL